MIIRDPSAILPLMGTAGWEKGARKLLQMEIKPFVDVFVIRLDGQDTEPSHPLTRCHTR